MRKNKGFTLIELLVVIAIIGILSAIVLASLSTARSKGNDAKVKSQVASIRAAAEIYSSNQNPQSYGTVVTACNAGMFLDTTSGIANLVVASSYPSGTAIACGSNGVSWAVSASLSGTPTTYACADSSGISTTTQAAATVNATSPALDHC